MPDGFSRRPNGNALHRAQAGSLPPRHCANFQLHTPELPMLHQGFLDPEAMSAWD